MNHKTLSESLVLVVEDDGPLRELITDELTEEGYQVIATGNIQSALLQLHQRSPDLVISDLRLPDGDGLSILDQCGDLVNPPAFIVITAFGTVEQAVTALQRGADNFLTKPLDLDHLRLSARRALERLQLQAQIERYKEALQAGDFHGLLGRSKAMRTLFEQIRRIARAAGPVLLQGESGVGKELVARAVHAESECADGPFIAVNCAGIPPDLLESELFGHSAGAFTGAQKSRAGLFVAAEGGTLLLDEIGEMPAAMQSKLLRVLQDGYLRPVGENRERRVNVRIIAATNRDLEADVASGAFREDLFYRLETFALEIPPLRHREDDIAMLAAHFVARFAAATDRPVKSLSHEALTCLLHYPFPGNVRELSNAIERGVAFATREEISSEDLPERIRRYQDERRSEWGQLHLDSLLDANEQPSLREIETRYVRYVLDKNAGNKRRAAEVLGIGRRTLYRYLDQGE